MPTRIIYYLLFLFLISDIGYSFLQHLNMPLYGDMAESILPADDVKKIFNDPLGLSVITKNEFHPNPNRFFGYLIFSEYFKTVPLAIQQFASPIDSVYLSCALAKIIIQEGIILLLAFYISGGKNIFRKEFLISAVLIVPLFQTNGYKGYMGIIDPSITYTFFYALPCALLLLFFLSFFLEKYFIIKFPTNIIIKVLLFILSIIMCYVGPLTPGIILIASLLFVISQISKHYREFVPTTSIHRVLSAVKRIPLHYLFFFVICILSIYSLYINKNNSYTAAAEVSTYQRYIRIPAGIYYLLTQKLGFPLLLAGACLNFFLIKKNNPASEAKKILSLFKWIGLFIYFYIVLLPLGGYKEYRPNILRYDTVIPITLSLIFFYGLSALYLIKTLAGKNKILYLCFIVSFSLIFTIADEPEFGKNLCERQGLQLLAVSKEKIVLIKNDCTMMRYEKIFTPDDSKLNCRLFKYWRIIKEDKLYYQEK